MKNNPTNRLKNQPVSQPTHRPENNLINRYLNRITKDNHSIILQDKEKNHSEKKFWKLFYKSPSRLFYKQSLKPAYKSLNKSPS